MDMTGLKQQLNALLHHLVASLNAKDKINEMQALDIIDVIVQEYKYLKFEELVFVFKQAKMGRYGKDYNRIDVMTICTWIDTYAVSDERLGYLESRHNKFKEESKPENLTTEEEGKFNEGMKRWKAAIDEANFKRVNEAGVSKEALNEESFVNGLLLMLPNYSDEELVELRKSYIEQKWAQGVKYVEDEMKHREQKP
jgi:hypothetical protein